MLVRNSQVLCRQFGTGDTSDQAGKQFERFLCLDPYVAAVAKIKAAEDTRVLFDVKPVYSVGVL